MIDQITRHQIYLQRLGSKLANDFEPFAVSVDRAIRDILSATEITTKKELNRVLSEIRAFVLDQYSSYGEQVLSELEELSQYESEWTADLLTENTAGADIVTADDAWKLALARPVTMGAGEGYSLTSLFKTFSERNTIRVLAVINNSYWAGETQMQMIRRIRGTKANKYKDGLLSTTARYAGVIARTANNHVSAQARQATYKANDDVVSKWEFVATLDRRTTNICRFNDGKTYDIGTGPIPPLHAGCRSADEPVVNPKFTLPVGKGTRASSGASGGKQVQDQDYYTWLGTQPKWFQQEVLGKAKTELFRKGGLSADEFRKLTSDNFGNPLTLDEIRVKDAQAWANAGLE